MSIRAANQAERLANRRSIAAVVMGTILIITQGQRMDDGGAGPTSWVVTGLVSVLFLMWASGFFQKTIVREFLNDESSELNRTRSLLIAFWNMIAAAIVCYVLTYFKEYGARDAIQVVITVGMSSALISFGVQERVFSHS